MKGFFVIILLILFLQENDAFAQWEQTNGPYGGHVASIVQNGSLIFLSCGNGIYRSNDSGQSWKQCNNGLINNYTTTLVSTNGTLFGIFQDGIYLSQDSGAH